MKEIIGVYLKPIERDASGLPISLYPFTRETEADAVPMSGPRIVVSDMEETMRCEAALMERVFFIDRSLAIKPVRTALTNSI